MSAIITENFRKNNAKRLLEDMADPANRYYVGIGKSDAWKDQGVLTEDDAEFDVVPALGTLGDQTEILNNLTTLIGITGSVYSQVIPNIAAKTNHRHKAYNPYDPDCFYQTTVSGIEMFPCYVVVSGNVYLCLRSPGPILPAYSFPSGVSTSRIPVYNADDGSVWVYVYSIAPEFPINGNQFVTVPTEPSVVNAETEMSVLDDIETASGHLVFGFTVINGGSGYVSAPTAQFIPFDTPGVPITLEATITSGTITSVVYNAGIVNNPGSWVKKPGYVSISGGGGSGAIVYPNVAPAAGIGSDPSQTLPSWYIGISVSAEEEIFGDGAFIPYRQISIVRNPTFDGLTADPELSLRCLQYIQITSDSAPAPGFDATGAVISQTASQARAIGDYYDSVTRRLYFHQTYETGFTEFNSINTFTIGDELTSYVPEEIGNSEYDKESGEVLFAENRKKITRTGGQTEELTIILQF